MEGRGGGSPNYYNNQQPPPSNQNFPQQPPSQGYVNQPPQPGGYIQQQQGGAVGQDRRSTSGSGRERASMYLSQNGRGAGQSYGNGGTGPGSNSLGGGVASPAAQQSQLSNQGAGPAMVPSQQSYQGGPPQQSSKLQRPIRGNSQSQSQQGPPPTLSTSQSSQSVSSQLSRSQNQPPPTPQGPPPTIAGEPLHDMGRAISLLKSSKFYAEGFLMRRMEVTADGKATHPNSPEGRWAKWFVQLSGTIMSTWNAAEMEEAARQNRTVPPQYLNLADAFLHPYPPNGRGPPPPTDYQFALNSAGLNRLLFCAPTLQSLTMWINAIRLAAWERSRCSEIYTGSLLGLREPRTPGGWLGYDSAVAGGKGKLEGWLKVRLPGDTEWRRVWTVVTKGVAPGSSGVGGGVGGGMDEKDKKKNRRTSLLSFGRKQSVEIEVPKVDGLPGDGALSTMAFYEFRPRGKDQPMCVAQHIFYCAALFPESEQLMESSTLFKVEGTFLNPADGYRTGWGVGGRAEKQGFSLVMLDEGTQMEMLHWIVGMADAFKLYGRPKGFSYDPRDPSSLYFALPVGPHRDRQFLDRELVDHLDINESRPRAIRATFHNILFDRMRGVRPAALGPPSPGNQTPPIQSQSPADKFLGNAGPRTASPSAMSLERRDSPQNQNPNSMLGLPAIGEAASLRSSQPSTRNSTGPGDRGFSTSQDNHQTTPDYLGTPVSRPSTALSTPALTHQPSSRSERSDTGDVLADYNTFMASHIGQESSAAGGVALEATPSQQQQSFRTSSSPYATSSAASSPPPNFSRPTPVHNNTVDSTTTNLTSPTSDITHLTYAAPSTVFDGRSSVPTARPTSPVYTPSPLAQSEGPLRSQTRLTSPGADYPPSFNSRDMERSDSVPTRLTSPGAGSDRNVERFASPEPVVDQQQQDRAGSMPGAFSPPPQPPVVPSASLAPASVPAPLSDDGSGLGYRNASPAPSSQSHAGQSQVGIEVPPPAPASEPQHEELKPTALGSLFAPVLASAAMAPVMAGIYAAREALHPTETHHDSTPVVEEPTQHSTAGEGESSLPEPVHEVVEVPALAPKLNNQALDRVATEDLHNGSIVESPESANATTPSDTAFTTKPLFSPSPSIQRAVSPPDLAKTPTPTSPQSLRAPLMVDTTSGSGSQKTVTPPFVPPPPQHDPDEDIHSDLLTAMRFVDRSESPPIPEPPTPSTGNSSPVIPRKSSVVGPPSKAGAFTSSGRPVTPPDEEYVGGAPGPNDYSSPRGTTSYPSSFAVNKRAEERAANAQLAQAAQAAQQAAKSRPGRSALASTQSKKGLWEDSDEEDEEPEDDGSDDEDDLEDTRGKKFGTRSPPPPLPQDAPIPQTASQQTRQAPQQHQQPPMQMHAPVAYGNIDARQSYYGPTPVDPERGTSPAIPTPPRTGSPVRVSGKPAVSPHGLLHAGIIEKEERSARALESQARDNGGPLVSIPSKPPPPQTGLVGAITSREREKERTGGIGKALTDQQRERKLAEQRQKQLDELQRQQLQQYSASGSGFMSPMNPMMMNPWMMGYPMGMGSPPLGSQYGGMGGSQYGGAPTPQAGGSASPAPQQPMMDPAHMQAMAMAQFAAQQAAQHAYMAAMSQFQQMPTSGAPGSPQIPTSTMGYPSMGIPSFPSFYGQPPFGHHPGGSFGGGSQLGAPFNPPAAPGSSYFPGGHDSRGASDAEPESSQRNRSHEGESPVDLPQGAWAVEHEQRKESY